MQKAEVWEKKEQVSENFTVTNQNTGTIAIRAEVFEDFEGTVKGSVKEESGIEYLFELCAANQYSTNLELPPGNYQLCTEAIEKDCRYRVLYDVAEITLKESELKSGKIFGCWKNVSGQLENQKVLKKS